MTCANIRGVQLTIIDALKNKPILYQFIWKIIKFIESKKTNTWLRDNKNCIMHLPMVFMEKIHQFFQLLANFLQNSVNTNKVKVGDSVFETKIVKTGVKLGAKFINIMIKHVEDNSIPKDIPAFAKNLFIKQTAGGAITLATAKSNATRNQEVVAALGEAGNK